ncbi:MAG: C-terminal helicase domain-containing protein, partial [Nanopusillaceae archaeon]
EMTQTEYIHYLYVMNKIPKETLIKLYKGTITENEIRKIKSWLMAAQQCLLSYDYIYGKSPEESIPSTKVLYTVKRIKESKEKSIVFTPFTTYGVKIINEALTKLGVKSKIYSGETSKEEKQKIVDEFENKDLQVICLTTSGAEGLNLPSCKNVYFESLHFNPEVLVQVMGRALRITSENPSVNIYYVISVYKGHQTIDGYMLNIIKKKKLLKQAVERILSENTIEETGMAAAGLTAYSTYDHVKINKTSNYKNKNKNKNGVFTVVYPK